MPQQQSKQPDFIPAATPDFIPAGGSDTAPTQQPAQQPEGFFHSLGTSLGLTPGAGQDAAAAFKAHPIETGLKNLVGGPALPAIEGAYQGVKRSGGELLDAASALRAGNPASAAVHAVSSVPILGPALVKGAQQAPASTGSYSDDVRNAITDPGTMGTLTGAAATAAPALLGGLDAIAQGRGMVGQIPSTARAVSKFESLNNDLADQAIPLRSTAAPLQRATELGVRGGTLPKPVSDLLTRSQSPIDPTYPELRDYQSNLSDLSREAQNSLNGKMRGAVGKLNNGVYQDIYDALGPTGRADDYASAMKEFRQAAQLKDLAIKSAKVAAPVGAAAVGAHALAPYLRKLF